MIHRKKLPKMDVSDNEKYGKIKTQKFGSKPENALLSFLKLIGSVHQQV
jgi:hypothetical protein